MAGKQPASEQTSLINRLREVLAQQQEETVGWQYQVLADGIIESRLRGSHQVLLVQFNLDDIVEVSEVKGNLLLTFNKSLTVKAENGEESQDLSWPLVLDWVKHSELKTELIRYYQSKGLNRA